MALTRFGRWCGSVLIVGLMIGGGAREASAQASLGRYEIGDFNGDSLADIGDYYQPTGHFWIRVNYGLGVFEMPGTSSGGQGNTVTPTTGWQTLVADFDGDGYADYADRFASNGNIYIHLNQHNGTWASGNWGSGGSDVGVNLEVLAGDVDGDGRADLIEHDRGTGLITILLNFGPGSSTFATATGTANSWLTQTGTAWRTLIGDFTGDGFVDLAEQYIPNGDIWVHANTHTNQFAFGGAYAGPQVIPPGSYTIIVGDFTGDGRADYATLNLSTGRFDVYAMTPGGVFSPSSSGFGFYSASPGFSVFGQPITF